MKSTPAGYVYGIDLIRFGAAMLVAAFHLTWRVPGASGWVPFGWVGVQAFFVVSGYVIMGSVRDRRPRDFAVGRVLRLYPAAWCAAPVLLACTAVFPAAYPALGIHVVGGLAVVPGALTLLSGPFPASAYWTLPVELGFYALVWVLVRLRALGDPRWLACGLVAWSAAYLGPLFGATMGFTDPVVVDFGYGVLNMTLMRHGGYFALGILVWVWRHARLGVPGLAFGALALGLAAIEIACRSAELAPLLADAQAPASTRELWDVAMLAFLAAFALVATSASARPFDRWPGRVRDALRTAGLVTYPMYLLHEALGGALVHLVRGAGGSMGSALTVALVGCLGVAWCVVRFGEPPLRRLLARWLRAGHAS